MHKLKLDDSDDRIFPKILRAQAQHSPAQEFLITDTRRITFGKAEAMTNALAGGLRACGLQRGDRIALYMGNRPEMVLLALAANKLGAIWTPINTDYKGQWLLDTLQRSRATVLVTDAVYQHQLASILAQLDVTQLVLIDEPGSISELPPATRLYSQLLQAPPLMLDYAEQDFGDTCAILWTSGTTGKSKGVLQSYNTWIRAIVDGASQLYDSTEGDIIYCMLPLYNTAAWITCIYRALLEGIPCVIEDKFSVSQFWQRVAHFGATQTFAIGAMGTFLLNAESRPDDANNPLRAALIVPIAPDLWMTFEQRFDLRLIRAGFGQSECQLLCNQLEDRADVPVYALGFPLADTRLGLFDEHGSAVAIGDTGEMWIKPLGPHIVCNGYFDDPQATADAYRGEWFMTGDLARQDPETGAYFYVDRKKDAVRFAGRNISTLEVESVVRRHPAVADVAAFGIPSAQIASEQELKLNIVLRPGQQASAEDLCAFINEHAPHYFVPRYIDFVASLPYTPTNKVQKYKLREQGVTSATWDLRQSSYRVIR